jgi:hypothetical protein
MATKKRISRTKAVTKVVQPKAAAVAAPITPRPGLTRFIPNLEHVSYRGAVPLKAFIGWVMLVITVALLVGMLAANLLIDQRLGQLVQETATRVELQGQGRAAVVSEWTKGVAQLGNTLEHADLIKLFAADTGGAALEPDMRAAVQAQKPYMDQLLKEFVQKNRLLGAHMVLPGGKVVLSEGILPEALVKGRDALQRVTRDRAGVILPLRDVQGTVVMDVLRPIFGLSTSDANAPVVGVLWFSLPVGDRMANLLTATPLDRNGERSTLIQHDGEQAYVVGRTALAPLAKPYMDIENRLGSGGEAVRAVQKSLVDATPVFGVLKPIAGTPFAVLQEYAAREALGMMVLYKPGIYLIVTLLIVVLAALMLALTLHLMGQRNKTRVKLLGQTMEALVRVVEARDPFLSGHHARVARLAIQAGNTLNMSVGERATLYYAAQLASVGRLLVPRGVLTKKGKLTPAERSDLEGHINQAIAILGDLEFDLPIVPVISQMYEREDGSGHPLGLKGAQISRMSQVLGACDAFVAMTSERPHRKALTKAEALKAMHGGALAGDVVGAIKKMDVK